MKRTVLLTAIALLMIFIGLLIVVSPMRSGGYLDLAATFAAYMPGNPLPEDAACNTFYVEAYVYVTYCHLLNVDGCRGAWVTAEDERIVRFTVHGCDLPLGYLIASYGRWEREQRYGANRWLNWTTIRAYVKSRRLYPMSTVRFISWSVPTGSDS